MNCSNMRSQCFYLLFDSRKEENSEAPDKGETDFHIKARNHSANLKKSIPDWSSCIEKQLLHWKRKPRGRAREKEKPTGSG